MYKSTQKNGGGCRPIGINKPAAQHFDRERFLKEWKQQEQDHQDWLLTPEGVEHTRLQAERQRLEEERQAKIQEERDKRDQHWKKFDALRANPVPGTVIDCKHNYTLKIQENHLRPGQLSVYALLRVEGDYPTEPHRTLASNGHRGLKVFLDNDSRKYLKETHAEVFMDLETQIQVAFNVAARRAERMADDNFSYKDMMCDSVNAFDLVGYIDINLPIQIIGIASGKSVQGKLIR